MTDFENPPLSNVGAEESQEVQDSRGQPIVLGGAQPAPVYSTGLDDYAGERPEWITLAQAVETTGVADKTLRRWIEAGRVKGRLVQAPTGEQWMVLLHEIRGLAMAKGIGQYAPESRSVPKDAQLERVTQLWTESVRAERATANELRHVEEDRGRFKAKYETVKERMQEMRADHEKRTEEMRAEMERLASLNERLKVLETKMASPIASLSPSPVPAKRRRWWGRAR